MTVLLLIPGLVSDSRIWQQLADDARMPTLHADVTRDRSITDMGQRLLEETNHDLIVVGHSMGGRVALEMARLMPSRIKALVLANTGHSPKREGEEIKRQQMIDLGYKNMNELARQWLPPMLDPARTGDKALIEHLKSMVLRAGARVHERQIRALIDRPDATSYLGMITCPVLLIAARQDNWSPIEQHQQIADAVGDAEMVVIENAGHFAPVERPQEVSSAILGWLDRKFGGDHG
ncbi:alpha/beta hydrolase [Agrobacterium larrymoorei]|uniref:alpha/beta fold hydrolase n=1 Tax=Agrobacterium larrymoorei TaxID=160699 RepID=UPI0015747A97|nr:alpha/beta hydrolase [Agrobacterium larrymoorei]